MHMYNVIKVSMLQRGFQLYKYVFYTNTLHNMLLENFFLNKENHERGFLFLLFGFDKVNHKPSTHNYSFFFFINTYIEG